MAKTPEERRLARQKFWADTKSDLKWATALLFVSIPAGVILLYYSGLGGFLGIELTGAEAQWDAAPKGEENLSAVSDMIFSQQGLVVPFEVLSVLLLAALIAGVVMAIRDPEGERP